MRVHTPQIDPDDKINIKKSPLPPAEEEGALINVNGFIEIYNHLYIRIKDIVSIHFDGVKSKISIQLTNGNIIHQDIPDVTEYVPTMKYLTKIFKAS